MKAGSAFIFGGLTIIVLGELSTFFFKFQYDLAVQILLYVAMVVLLYFAIKRR